MEWFWYFLFYSFLGFLLEVGYALWAGGNLDRKCLLLLPLCPVYGLGACAVLLLPAPVLRVPGALLLLGGLTATAVEYITALFYQKVLHVSFWNYENQLGSLHGRVCLPFSLAWSFLLLPMVHWVHPAAVRWIAHIPSPVSWAALAALCADMLVSAVLLRSTADIRSLQWYRLRPAGVLSRRRDSPQG